MNHPFVPEYGHVRAMTQAGVEFVFIPALSSMAAIGSPAEIVQTYAELHADEERFCVRAARAVLYACVVDCEDLSELVGWLDDAGHHSGLMPNDEQVALAKHLMKNGIVGKAQPGDEGGGYSETFDAAEHIANAVVHLGLSRAEAAQLTMTELHYMLDAKFPRKKSTFEITREDYERGMKEAEETLARLAAREAANHV